APVPPPVSMSETGSFHLAPPPAASQPSAASPGIARPQQEPYPRAGLPQPGLPQPGLPQAGLPQPGFQQPPSAPYAADAPPAYAVGAPDPSQAPTSGVRHDPSATRPYTAQQRQQFPPVPAPPVQH
ncbi:serine/threonine protein kinase, partial [Streptomyces sp. MBT98]|nr:serine/threonine protein kinase [Streptomyces sp. MBT98]